MSKSQIKRIAALGGFQEWNDMTDTQRLVSWREACDEIVALRAEVERLRAALYAIATVDPTDEDDRNEQGAIAYAALYPPPSPVIARPQRMDLKRFQKAPCYICGYNGPNYYQPEVHDCAGLYHEQTNEMP